jgi:hypothetical protein
MRKGLLREAVTGEYSKHGDIAEVDCVIGFSFGYRVEKGQAAPGLSNEGLAKIVERSFTTVPLILQWEIADALANPPVALWRIQSHRERSRYLDTREVACQAREIMKTEAFKTAAVLAHPNHVGRADAVCQKLGISTVVSDGLQGARFDPKSAQPWTRQQPAWSLRETIAIAYYRSFGWI